MDSKKLLNSLIQRIPTHSISLQIDDNFFRVVIDGIVSEIVVSKDSPKDVEEIIIDEIIDRTINLLAKKD